MEQSIRAIDGSYLDFVHVRDASAAEALYLNGVLGDKRGCLLFKSALEGDQFYAMQESIPTVWFLRRRGDRHYCGVCHYSYDEETDTVYPVVDVEPRYRGNGYGRAAVLFMCELSGASRAACVSGPKDFCEWLGMSQEGPMYVMSVDKEVPVCP